MAVGARPDLRATLSRPDVWALVLAVVACSALLTLAAWRTPVAVVWADEGTFLAMTESLAEDGDLLFTEDDRERLEDAEKGRAALILEQTERGIAYSKPVVLALLATPFFAVFGASGLVIFNVVVLSIAILLALAVLQRVEARDGRAPGSARLVVVTFLLAAVVMPYVFWRMADLLQCALVLSGLSLVVAADRGLPAAGSGPIERLLSWRGAPWLGTVLVALTVSMRVSNGAVAVIPVLSAIFAGHWRRGVARAVVVTAVVGVLAATTWGLTGAVDPYRAKRTTFLPQTGYPAGPGAEVALARFDVSPATHHTFLAGPREAAYGAFYALAGRHTGLLVYFPAAVLLVWVALRRSDAAGRACLLGAGVAITFFAVAKPENYFGGETFLGNRYFLSIYPVLLLAPTRLPRWRGVAAVWVVAIAAYASALVSVATTRDLDPGSQSHVRAGLFRAMPYESTAQAVEGRRDRYWAGQFVRFVDPFAEVEPLAFELEAGRPAAELMVVHWQPPGTQRYQVETDAAEATLVIEDYRRRYRFAVGRDRAIDGGPVGFDLGAARPWRYHRFWFEDQVYWSRVLRWRLDAPAGTRARVIHLGDPAVVAGAFAYQLVSAEVPDAVAAGADQPVTLVVENTSRNHWEAKGTIPVTARWRLERDGEPVAEGAERLADRVAPTGRANLSLPIPWPCDGGPVDLEVDLVLERVAWFRDRLGEPLLRRTVQVDEVERASRPAPCP